LPIFGKDQIGTGHASSEIGKEVILLARVRVSNVHILQYLRDLVLHERNEQTQTFCKQIEADMRNEFDVKDDSFTIELDKSSFLCSYERLLCTLEKLTKTQEDVRTKYREKLRALLAEETQDDVRKNSELRKIPSIRIDGAAGTGKTFLALHDLLSAIEKGQRVLFVARNTALSYFVAAWAYHRLRLSLTEKVAITKMAHFSTLSLEEGHVSLRRCLINEKTSEISFFDPLSMYPSVATRALSHFEVYPHFNPLYIFLRPLHPLLYRALVYLCFERW
jgi:hypothetical protein